MKPSFYLMRPKDVIPTCKQMGLIYSIPCKDCEIKYISVRLNVPLRQDKKNNREVYGWQKQKIQL